MHVSLSEDRLQHRALPCPIRADECRDPAGFDREVDAVQDTQGAVAADDVQELDRRRHRVTSSPRYALITVGSFCTEAGSPSAITRPSAITMTRRQSRITKSMLCSMTTKVVPRSRFCASSICRMS